VLYAAGDRWIPDLARCHQTKQGPCRLRSCGGGGFVSAVVEPIAPGILAPTAVVILGREQPRRRLANNGILMIDARGIKGAQGRPGAVNVIQAPAAVPRSLSELGAAQISDPVRQRLT